MLKLFKSRLDFSILKLPSLTLCILATFTQPAWASTGSGAQDLLDNSNTYAPPKTFDAFKDCCQGPQGGKQYRSDDHPQTTPPEASPIKNGKTPPNHAGGGSGGSSKTNPNGQPIITEQKKDPNNCETAVKADGPETPVKYVSQKDLEPRSKEDKKPCYRHKGTVATPKSKRNAVGGAANSILHSIGNHTESKGDAGVPQSGKKAHSGLPLIQSNLATLLGSVGDQVRQQVTNPAAAAGVAKGAHQAQNAQNSDNQGNAAQANCAAAFDCMILPLINVANENAGSRCSAHAAFKTESDVVWMVQQMYKQCYIPMALLLLLPGAIITQTKCLVSFGILGAQDEDTTSPFIGIFRALVAVFLIPTTQLAVSYCIDIGNALTAPVAEQVKVGILMNWVREQAYATDPKNNDGCIKKILAKQCQGKVAGTSAKSAVQERMSDLTVGIQNWVNTVANMLGQGLEILSAFQFIMMLYLFLLGPIAAALYAWPAGVGKDLFKKAFSSWLDGVIVLSLWKFWWCIVLLCMVVRLQQGVNATDEFELYYFAAFMGILVMAPFQPFEFKPGEIVSHVLEKAQQHSGGGGGGGSGGGGGGGASGQGGNPQGGGSSGGKSNGTANTKGAGAAQAGLDSPMAGDVNSGRGDGNSGSSRGASERAYASAEPIDGFIDAGIEPPPSSA